MAIMTLLAVLLVGEGGGGGVGGGKGSKLPALCPFVIKCLACENSLFSPLLAAGDILRRGTSVTQRQKFHTDDVKSDWNPVISADWTRKCYIVLAIVYE